jgi:predicted transposase YdaD
MIDKIPFSHDKFFKVVMSNIKLAKALISNFLPEKLIKSLDLDTLRLNNTQFVSDDLKEIFSDTLLKSILLTQKYIFDKDKLLNKLSTILEVFYNEKERNLLETIIVYIFDNIEEIKIQEILLILPVKIKEEVMTIAQKLKKEGIKEGIKEGEYRAKVKTIINGYKKGLSIDILSALSDLNQEDVKKIIDEHKNQD